MRNSPIQTLALIILALCLTPAPCFAAGAPFTELVQSAPVETNLAVPGIRETSQVWTEMINSAQKSIDLEEFYIYTKKGTALDPVMAALESAAARGVQVRLIVDQSFLPDIPLQSR